MSDILVSFLTGASGMMYPDTSDTVGYFKMQIEKQFNNCAHESMRLMHCGQIMDDDRTLADYNVRSESQLQVIPKLYGASSFITEKTPRGYLPVDCKQVSKQFEQDVEGPIDIRLVIPLYIGNKGDEDYDPIEGECTWDENAKTATFFPAGELPGGTNFRMRVQKGDEQPMFIFTGWSTKFVKTKTITFQCDHIGIDPVVIKDWKIGMPLDFVSVFKQLAADSLDIPVHAIGQMICKNTGVLSIGTNTFGYSILFQEDTILGWDPVIEVEIAQLQINVTSGDETTTLDPIIATTPIDEIMALITDKMGDDCSLSFNGTDVTEETWGSIVSQQPEPEVMTEEEEEEACGSSSQWEEIKNQPTFEYRIKPLKPRQVKLEMQ